MALVVGAPDVDHAVEAAQHELVEVVGDVGREVGRLAAAAHDHVVLVVAGGGGEPDRPLFLHDVAAIAQVRHRRLVGRATGRRLAGRQQRGLAEPAVEVHAEQSQVAADLIEHAAQALRAEGIGRCRRIEVQELLAPIPGDRLRQVDHVAPHVAPRREVGLASEVLPVARHERLAEDAHLRPGVVDVVLALDVVAGGLQHAGQHVAQHRAAAVADLQRAGGVGRDELHLQRLPGAQIDRAPGVRRGQHRVDLRALPVGRQPQVDEAGRRDLDRGDQRPGPQRLRDRPRDLQRRALDRARQPQRHAARVVAVLGVLGPLDGDLGAGQARQRAARLGVVERCRDRVTHVVPNEMGHRGPHAALRRQGTIVPATRSGGQAGARQWTALSGRRLRRRISGRRLRRRSTSARPCGPGAGARARAGWDRYPAAARPSCAPAAAGRGR